MGRVLATLDWVSMSSGQAVRQSDKLLKELENSVWETSSPLFSLSFLLGPSWELEASSSVHR